MDKKFLLAIVLSFLVIYGWQAMFPPPPPTKPAPAPQQVTSQPSGTAAPATQPVPSTEPKIEPEAAKPLVAASAEQDIPFENAAVQAVLSTRGGVVKSWRLKNYRDGQGAPLELVPQNVPGAAKPFTLEVDDPAITAKLREALFKPDPQSTAAGSAGSRVAFEYRGAAGRVARKVFAFSTPHT